MRRTTAAGTRGRRGGDGRCLLDEFGFFLHGHGHGSTALPRRRTHGSHRYWLDRAEKKRIVILVGRSKRRKTTTGMGEKQYGSDLVMVGLVVGYRHTSGKVKVVLVIGGCGNIVTFGNIGHEPILTGCGSGEHGDFRSQIARHQEKGRGGRIVGRSSSSGGVGRFGRDMRGEENVSSIFGHGKEGNDIAKGKGLDDRIGLRMQLKQDEIRFMFGRVRRFLLLVIVRFVVIIIFFGQNDSAISSGQRFR